MVYNKENVEIKVQEYVDELILCFFEIEDGPLIPVQIDNIEDFKPIEKLLGEIDFEEGCGIYHGKMSINEIQNLLIGEGFIIKYI